MINQIEAYVTDPLVLVGFLLLLCYLFLTALLKSRIIPPISPGRGALLLNLIVHYGFVISVIIILLGFGLKYRALSLSRAEQESVVEQLKSELGHNTYIVRELKSNAETLKNVADVISSVLRDERFPINSGLFVAYNIDTQNEEDPDLYNKRLQWLVDSNLLSDSLAVGRHIEQNKAIKRTIHRTKSTIKSLADRNAIRYKIHRESYDANLPILRKVNIVNITALAQLYARTEEVREKYFRVADIVLEYADAIDEYTSDPKPTHSTLGAALAAERLSYRLLEAVADELYTLADATADLEKQLSIQELSGIVITPRVPGLLAIK